MTSYRGDTGELSPPMSLALPTPLAESMRNHIDRLEGLRCEAKAMATLDDAHAPYLRVLAATLDGAITAARTLVSLCELSEAAEIVDG